MLTLTDDDIKEITNKTRRAAQKRELKALGIRFQERRDGSILVYRHAVDKGRIDTMPSREPQLRLRNGSPSEVR